MSFNKRKNAARKRRRKVKHKLKLKNLSSIPKYNVVLGNYLWAKEDYCDNQDIKN